MTIIKNVAERAGGSITTVSHMIDKTRFVREELTRQVNKAIEKVNYRPRQLARSLRRRRAQMIAALVLDIVNPFFPQGVHGTEDSAKESGYGLVLCNTDENPQMENFYVSLIIDCRVDGFIIVPSRAAEESLIRKSIPLVIIDRPMETLSSDQVYSDNVTRAYQAAKYLGEGLSQATAIFATNNLMTLGVLHYLRKHNVSHPKDLSGVGFDGPEWGSKLQSQHYICGAAKL